MTRRITILSVLVALAAVAVWRVAREQPRPPMPDIPLEGAAPALIDAVAAAKAKVEAEPRSADAWGGLGNLLGVNGFHTQAIVCYSHAAELDPASPRWPYLQANECVQAGRPRDAIPLLARAAERTRTRDEALTVRYGHCDLLIDEGFLDEAAIRVREFASFDGEGERSRHLQALLARSRGEREEAQRALEALLPSPHYGKRARRMLAELSEPARSRELLAAAEKLPPDAPFPDAFTANLGSLRVSSPNRLDEYYQLLRQNPDDALVFLKHIAADATDSAYPSTLGQALLQRGQWGEAADAFRHAIRIDAKNAQARTLLAEALETQSRTEKQPEAAARLLDEALAQADAALRLQANSGQAHSVRGRVLLKRKRAADAIAAFREAVTCQPESAAMHRELGEALTASGDVAAGVASLEVAAQLAPNDEAIRAALAKWKK